MTNCVGKWHTRGRSSANWSKPIMGCFKCNVDATFDRVRHIVCLGMCIWDEQGSCVMDIWDKFVILLLARSNITLFFNTKYVDNMTIEDTLLFVFLLNFWFIIGINFTIFTAIYKLILIYKM